MALPGSTGDEVGVGARVWVRAGRVDSLSCSLGLGPSEKEEGGSCQAPGLTRHPVLSPLKIVLALKMALSPVLRAKLGILFTVSRGLGGSSPHLGTQQNSSLQGNLCPTLGPGAPSSFQGPSLPKAKCLKGRKLSLALYSQQERASALWDGVGRAGHHFLGGRGCTPCNH